MKALVFALLAAGALHSYHIRVAAVVGTERFACEATYSGMFWSWQDGYKFFRFDARVRGSDGRTSGFVFHLGSTSAEQIVFG
jgi:hypothetical protein